MPQLTNIEANLVQGRWRENFIPRVQSFVVDPNQTNRELPDEIGFLNKEPGFTMDVHS